MTSNFKHFCEHFTYINGIEQSVSNCMSVYYNIQLVLSKHRISFMVQPIDYTYAVDYSRIIQNILENYDMIDTKCHPQGTLIFLKENLTLINLILDSLQDKNDNQTLGQVLSYPCYSHINTRRFISLYINDAYGKHQLLANYYNDDGTIFKNGVKKWVNYLLDNYYCYATIEINDLSNI